MKTPWINYKKMKEVSSKQIDYTEWMNQIKLSNNIDHASQLNSTDSEKKDKTCFAAHLDSNRELLIPSVNNDEEEIVHHLDPEETDETNTGEEQDFAAQLNSDCKIVSPSESDVGNKVRRPIDIEEMAQNSSTDSGHASSGTVCSITQKTPFSTHVTIDDFLHAPICGEMVRNTFEFLDLNNHLTPQFETKLFNTTTDYPEQPNCRLVRSKINEIICLMQTDTNDKNSQKNNPSKSVVVPLHSAPSIKKGETNNHAYSSDDFMHIRVPVVVGEYKIEIGLEENILFEKGIVAFKEISNEVILTDCRFVPHQFSQALGNGTCTASKANLFIEGYIHQNIEYTSSYTRNAVPAQNESLNDANQLYQNIVLELIIHILQVQQIRVSYDSQGTRG
ncbi:BC_2427 family protein [Lysinibacillus parviboronicapiens]|uniref:BC_2427 family protein n=1 Tax=Lysinibacillus parviboronicapiens TaxID=436516 RepID=UPI000D358D00|nr:hypothetical protein [Lysinibacillus parviboronicapiens]